MKNKIIRSLVSVLLAVFLLPSLVSGETKEISRVADSSTIKGPKTTCDTSVTTVCTIEMWLAHKQKKNKREIKDFLKSKSIKVLHHTMQFWRPTGGHP
ncbi:MAG: hypothetical protein ACE5EK_06480, partial [Nitrospinales bacterium]